MAREEDAEALETPLVSQDGEHKKLDLPALISDFSKLMDFMNMLWWPELSLSPLFFGFGFWAWEVVPYVVQFLCYSIITVGKYIQILKLKDIIRSLNAFEEQYAAVRSVHCMSGWFVDKISLHDVNGNVHSSGTDGGCVQDPFDIDIDAGERLTEINGRMGDKLQIVQFGTNFGKKSQTLGLTEHAQNVPEFTFQAAAGNHIVGINRIGFCGLMTGVIEQGMDGPRLARVEQEIFLRNDKISMFICEVPLPWPKWATLAVTTIPTYLELQASCMAAGASFSSWSDVAQASWVSSWSVLFGHTLASHTNLPMALTGMAVFRIYNHARGYKRNAKIASVVLEETSREGTLEDVESFLPLFVAVTAAADSANLLMVAAVTSLCAKSLNLAMGKDRTVRFFQKVLLGTAPALWLKISLLQHTFDDLKEAGRSAVIVAIVLALLAAAEPIKEQVDYVMNYEERVKHATRLNKHASIAHLKRGQCINVLTLALACLLMIASFIRFAGVWLCIDSHTFQLSTMQCLTAVDSRHNATHLQYA